MKKIIIVSLILFLPFPIAKADNHLPKVTFLNQDNETITIGEDFTIKWIEENATRSIGNFYVCMDENCNESDLVGWWNDYFYEDRNLENSTQEFSKTFNLNESDLVHTDLRYGIFFQIILSGNSLGDSDTKKLKFNINERKRADAKITGIKFGGFYEEDLRVDKFAEKEVTSNENSYIYIEIEDLNDQTIVKPYEHPSIDIYINGIKKSFSIDCNQNIYNLGKLTAGQHDIKLILNPDKYIEEDNYNNNSFETTLNVQGIQDVKEVDGAKVDLIITAIFGNNNNKYLNVYFNRIDSEEFKPYKIKLYDKKSGHTDYKDVDSQVMDSVGFYLGPGEFDLALTIDSENSIDEYNEDNNITTRSIVFSQDKEKEIPKISPDLTPISLEINNTSRSNDEPIEYYDMLEITPTFKNMGDSFSDNFYYNVQFRNNGKDDIGMRSNLLGLGHNETYSNTYITPWPYETTYEENFTLIVDERNSIDESNEDNNILTKKISIEKKSNNSNSDDSQESDQQVNVEEKSQLLFSGQINEPRNISKEQESRDKYLTSLNEDIKKLSKNVENIINNFITYGVDDNTKRLGAGERAAVIYSYKSAFNKLPETENELADIIKISNGRWPSVTNEKAEKRAKEQFQKIYKKIADMYNPKDNAAVTVMAYGLRQKAENRNLESEKQGIKTFKNIFAYHPVTTNDWNIMQAITYSGATRGIDSDGDLLTDERELELKTDPNNKDTDGDGYIDGIEVANGYDPLGK